MGGGSGGDLVVHAAATDAASARAAARSGTGTAEGSCAVDAPTLRGTALPPHGSTWSTTAAAGGGDTSIASRRAKEAGAFQRPSSCRCTSLRPDAPCASPPPCTVRATSPPELVSKRRRTTTRASAKADFKFVDGTAIAARRRENVPRACAPSGGGASPLDRASILVRCLLAPPLRPAAAPSIARQVSSPALESVQSKLTCRVAAACLFALAGRPVCGASGNAQSLPSLWNRSSSSDG